MGVVIGIDEVGRGSWAGPLLVVAAYARADLPESLADSKLLSKQQREMLIDDIKTSCKLGEGWVQPEEIDEHGLARAMRIGVSRALIMLAPAFGEEIIMDGLVNYCPPEFTNVKCVVNADGLHPIVSAASIYAKVQRDRHMVRLSQLYPVYRFDKHAGYGTKLHSNMLKAHGPCRIHRKSYKPVQLLAV